MSKETELKITLYAISDDAHVGPIALDTYEHHTLDLISNNMHVLGFSQGDYRAFRPAANAFVETGRTFRDLKAKKGEPFVLTKDLDLEMTKLIWKVIRPADAPEEAAPPVNVKVGVPGVVSIDTNVTGWGKWLREKLRRWIG